MPYTGNPESDMAELRKLNPGASEQDIISTYVDQTQQVPASARQQTGTPFARGIEAAKEQFKGGLSDIQEGGMGLLTGPFKMLGAPGAGVRKQFSSAVAEGTGQQETDWAPWLVGGGMGLAADVATGKALGTVLSPLAGPAKRAYQTLFPPGLSRAEAIAKATGEMTGTATDLAGQMARAGNPEVKQLFQIAEAIPTPIKSHEIVEHLSDSLSKIENSGAMSPSTKKSLMDSFTSMKNQYNSLPQGSAKTSYWVREEQLLAQRARDLLKGENPNSTEAKFLNDARQSLLGMIEKADPSGALKVANAATRMSSYTDSLFELMQSGKSAGDKFSLLIRTDPQAAEIFGLKGATGPQINDAISKVQQAASATDPQSKLGFLTGALSRSASFVSHYVTARYAFEALRGLGR